MRSGPKDRGDMATRAILTQTEFFEEEIPVPDTSGKSVSEIMKTLWLISMEGKKRTMTRNQTGVNQNMSDLIGAATVEIHSLLRDHNMTLTEVYAKLREHRFDIWPFLLEIPPTHVYKCINVLNFDEVCQHALYIFLGNEQSFIEIELIPRQRTLKSNEEHISKNIPGVLVVRD